MRSSAAQGYVRPDIDLNPYVADDGVRFGDHWEDGPAPDEAYATISHPERFERIVLVANSIIEHLSARYEVTVEVDEDAESRVEERPAPDRRVTLTPASPHAAPISFDLYPSSVVLTCGLLSEFVHPDCMCDACDAQVITEVESLESEVFGVVDGGLSESVTGAVRLWKEHELDASGTSRTGRCVVFPEDKPVVKAARRALKEFGGEWAPWPLKSVVPAD
ncbi:DUF6226 family protein [Gordonia zhaorongruii]|uniref:DUF6226 family protein n=1 Tax=Gordonia zhaorongruii TaxID=2597659 RepID=UPI0010476D19|nr:DUF6226 family protein [Gordonia zhaorongruii]